MLLTNVTPMNSINFFKNYKRNGNYASNHICTHFHAIPPFLRWQGLVRVKSAGDMGLHLGLCQRPWAWEEELHCPLSKRNHQKETRTRSSPGSCSPVVLRQGSLMCSSGRDAGPWVTCPSQALLLACCPSPETATPDCCV